MPTVTLPQAQIAALFEPPPHPPLLERGYLDLPCGCRAYARQNEDNAWHIGHIYPCGAGHCLSGETLPLYSRVAATLDAGQPLVPRAVAWTVETLPRRFLMSSEAEPAALPCPNP
mgnify:FL=1